MSPTWSAWRCDKKTFRGRGDRETQAVEVRERPGADVEEEEIALVVSNLDEHGRGRLALLHEGITTAEDRHPEIRDAVASDPSAELVELIERAIGHVVRVILKADDSDGTIGDVARSLLNIHATACDAGVADPIKLARWMIRFTLDKQDFFVADPGAVRRCAGRARARRLPP
jgi:hypothetical protein